MTSQRQFTPDKYSAVFDIIYASIEGAVSDCCPLPNSGVGNCECGCVDVDQCGCGCSFHINDDECWCGCNLHRLDAQCD